MRIFDLRPIVSLAAAAAVMAMPVAAPLRAAQAYAPAARNIVGVEMRSSCEAAAAPDVDRGVAFLLAMAPADARRAFERAADADPDCALAGWGRAMSLLPADPLRVDDGALRQGQWNARPVDVREAADGAVYFSDDAGGRVFKITYSK